MVNRQKNRIRDSIEMNKVRPRKNRDERRNLRKTKNLTNIYQLLKRRGGGGGEITVHDIFEKFKVELL